VRKDLENQDDRIWTCLTKGQEVWKKQLRQRVSTCEREVEEDWNFLLIT